MVADKAQDAGAVLADKAQDVGGKAADKAGDLAVSAKDKSKELGGRAADKAGEVPHPTVIWHPQRITTILSRRQCRGQGQELWQQGSKRD